MNKRADELAKEYGEESTFRDANDLPLNNIHRAFKAGYAAAEKYALNNKVGEVNDVGAIEHRGNTVDYVYDKCLVYGDQLGWRYNQLNKIRNILDEQWEGSDSQKEAFRRNEEYNALKAENERLRKALSDIIALEYGHPSARSLAKEALSQK